MTHGRVTVTGYDIQGTHGESCLSFLLLRIFPAYFQEGIAALEEDKAVALLYAEGLFCTVHHLWEVSLQENPLPAITLSLPLRSQRQHQSVSWQLISHLVSLSVPQLH